MKIIIEKFADILESLISHLIFLGFLSTSQTNIAVSITLECLPRDSFEAIFFGVIKHLSD